MTALACLAGGDAWAQASPGDNGQKLLPLWELGVGVAALRLPDYRGADQATNYLLPLPYVVYRGDWLRADREGARAVLLDAQRLEVDVSAALAAPAHNNAARQGMPDLAARVEIGPSANFEFWRSSDHRTKLEIRAPLRAAYALERSPQSVGWTFNPHLNLDLRGLASGWDTALQAGAVFGDRRFHAHLYGVDASAATAQRPAYEARAGYAGWLALAGASRRFDNTWVGAFVRYDSLRGAVIAASPLVKTEQNLTFGIGVSWIFSVSDQLVSVEK
ncbi:MAG: MipA/OmpV family protein [Burkholderiaceae bacterium]